MDGILGIRRAQYGAAAQSIGRRCFMNDPRHSDDASLRAERLRETAIAWLSRLSSGSATVADAEALKQWLREDPEHVRAYAQEARGWRVLKEAVAEIPRPETARFRRPLGRRAFLGGALATGAACAAVAVVHPPLDLWPSLAEWRADLRTGVGEHRRVVVADGVELDLNTRSSLGLGVGGGDNPIELIAGEAIITAGQRAASVIAAGVGRILAQNAKVDVRNDDAEVRVVCVDGRVQVRHPGQTVVLAARERVTYNERAISSIEVVDPAVITAWQDGRLIFRKEPLARVIDQVNRYRPGRIILIDRSLGSREIDASFRIDKLDNVFVYLRQAFNARVTTLPGGIVLVG